jgi:hemerythrin superfamily protein
MDATRMLEAQHREIEILFADFFDAPRDDEDLRQMIFTRLADRIAAHARIEEEVFYPRVAAEPTEELVEESFDEHYEVKRVLVELMPRSCAAPGFERRLRDLQSTVERHLLEEEEELFPRVRRMLSAQAREELGHEMEVLLEEIIARGEPRSEMPGQLMPVALW